MVPDAFGGGVDRMAIFSWKYCMPIRFKAEVKHKKQQGVWSMSKFAFYSCLKHRKTQ